MRFGLPWSEAFIAHLADKEDRDEFVADQVRVHIALAVRALREQRGLSQAEFGRLLGKPQSVVSRLEDPDYGRVSVQTLLDVAAALDIPLFIGFPEWEDWFRGIRQMRKADLQRKPFDGIGQSAKAAADTTLLRFPVGGREGIISATVASDGANAVRIRAHA